MVRTYAHADVTEEQSDCAYLALCVTLCFSVDLTEVHLLKYFKAVPPLYCAVHLTYCDFESVDLLTEASVKVP